MDITKLRGLIRTGEFLEENYTDDKVRSRWLFDVENFAKTNGHSNSISSALHSLKFHGGKPITRNHFNVIMGFLRSLYDSDTSENMPMVADSQAVFIVHGHDDSLITDVKTCVEQAGYKPIVLREQLDGGKTIIEKLEDWLGNCKCAIILYTPCDSGKEASASAFENRARQNVVYEHGLFQGYLGRKRVVLLRKSNTTLPSDICGVAFTSVDELGWQEKLQGEIRAINN